MTEKHSKDSHPDLKMKLVYLTAYSEFNDVTNSQKAQFTSEAFPVIIQR